MIGKYLIHCFLYYQLDTAVIPDEEFDQLCRDLLANWDSIDHPHKHLISKDDLSAGTGFTLNLADYPAIVRTIANLIVDYRAMGRDYLNEMEEFSNV